MIHLWSVYTGRHGCCNGWRGTGLEEGWFGGKEDSGHKAQGESGRKSWLRLMMGTLMQLICSDLSMDPKGTLQHLQHL